MIRHYLKTALRFLRRNRLYAGINLLGLSISLAVSFIILVYVINEFSVDRYHLNGKRIYRVLNYYREFDMTMGQTPFVMASTIREEFPQVEQAVNVRYVRSFSLKLGEDLIKVGRPIGTGSEIFRIFSIPLGEGRLMKDPLRDMNSIVISRSLAGRFFPGEDPVGKEITGMINQSEQVFLVTGVFEDLPPNSTLRADCMINGRWELEPLNQTFGSTDMETNWTRNFWATWILLEEGASAETLEAGLRDLEKKHISEDPPFRYSLQRLSDGYLRSDHVANPGITGNMKNIRLFSGVAFLIVLIAAINYIILSVAVSTGRAREIGIRKTAGAGRARIRNQMLGESVVMALLVLPLAILLMRLALPVSGRLFRTELEIISSNLWIYILFYLVLTVLIGLTSGIYASSYLSRMKVLDVIHRKVSFGKRRRIFRSALIITQLIIFTSFVAGTLVIRSQYLYAIGRDPGHYKEDILQIYLGREFSGYEAFLNNIRSLPEVRGAAGAMVGLPMEGYMTFMHPHFQDREKSVRLEGYAVDYHLPETVGFRLIEGRFFSEDYGSDLESSVILNETAVRELGIVDPAGQMIGDQVIIGVVKDFNLHSIHHRIPPLVISMTDRYLHHILVHHHPGTLNRLVPKLEKAWDAVEPDRPMEFATMEEIFHDTYASERNLTTILSVASLFSLLIAAFGLFGLAFFVTSSRRQEIGIRKVFGSPEGAIVKSFLRGNLFLVVVASLLSIPVTLWLMTRWLNNFPYRTDIGWWVFPVAFLIAAIVVMLTVLFQAIRASRTNPVETLRYE